MELRQNSCGYAIGVTCYESDGTTPFSFTGYTVTLRAWAPGVPATVVFSGSCSVSGTSNNIASYVVKTNDLATIALLSCEIIATSTGVAIKFQPFDIKVKEAA